MITKFRLDVRSEGDRAERVGMVLAQAMEEIERLGALAEVFVVEEP